MTELLLDGLQNSKSSIKYKTKMRAIECRKFNPTALGKTKIDTILVFLSAIGLTFQVPKIKLAEFANCLDLNVTGSSYTLLALKSLNSHYNITLIKQFLKFCRCKFCCLLFFYAKFVVCFFYTPSLMSSSLTYKGKICHSKQTIYCCLVHAQIARLRPACTSMQSDQSLSFCIYSRNSTARTSLEP